MHFGLYAFDLYEIIYQEAWDARLVPPEDFGYQTSPILQHLKTRPSGQKTGISNYGCKELTLSEAEVVITEVEDFGDGIEARMPYLIAAGTNLRIPTIYRALFI